MTQSEVQGLSLNGASCPHFRSWNFSSHVAILVTLEEWRIINMCKKRTVRLTDTRLPAWYPRKTLSQCPRFTLDKWRQEMIACFHPQMKYGFFLPRRVIQSDNTLVFMKVVSRMWQINKLRRLLYHLLKSCPAVIAREGGTDGNVPYARACVGA